MCGSSKAPKYKDPVIPQAPKQVDQAVIQARDDTRGREISRRGAAATMQQAPLSDASTKKTRLGD